MKSKRISQIKTTNIFVQIAQLAEKLSCLQLSSGTADFKPPTFVQDELIISIQEMNDITYAAPGYHPVMNKSVVDNYSKYFNRTLKESEVLVAGGANVLLKDVFTSFLDDEDEIIMFDPFFPSFLDIIRSTVQNPVFKYVELNYQEDSQRWTFDINEFRSKLTKSTKMLILNSPHNPTGKVFTQEEYQQIVDVLKDFPDILIVSDEVYEHFCFTQEPTYFASNIDIFDRTISIYCLEKMFSCTGYMTSFLVAPENLVNIIRVALINNAYNSFRPCYRAFGKALYNSSDYFKGQVEIFKNNQIYLKENIKKTILDIKILHAEGAFFVLADVSGHIENMQKKYFYKNFEDSKDDTKMNKNLLKDCDYQPNVAFLYYLAHEYQVTVIPCPAFFIKNEHNKNNLVRIKICTQRERLEQFINKLKQ